MLNGPLSIYICDNDLGDADLSDGAIELDAVPAGTYSVQVAPIDGFEITEPIADTTVEADVVAAITVVMRPIATVEPTVEQPLFGVLLVQSTLEDGSTLVSGVCLTLVGDLSIEVCDNTGDEVEPTDGVIELDAIPVGGYTVEVTAPEGFEFAGDAQSIVVDEGVVATLALVFRQVETVEPTTEASATGVLVVQSTLEDGVTLVPGVCLTLRGPIELSVCDNDGSDVDSFDGAIEVNALSTGQYAVDVSPPEGFDLVEGVSDLLVEPDTVAQILLVLRPAESATTEPVLPTEEATVEATTEPTTEVTAEATEEAVAVPGSLVVQLVDSADGVTPLLGACVDITGPDGTTLNGCDDAGIGEIRFDGIVVGTWTVQLTLLPEGYLASDAQTAEIASESETRVVFALDRSELPTGTIIVTAIDEDGNLLGGGCFALRGPDDTLLELCDDDADGLLDFGPLIVGDWSITQTAPPAGHDPAETSEQTFVIELGIEVQISFVNPTSPAETSGYPPVIPSPEAVSLISDFQDEIGCESDLESECEVTRLSQNGDVWSTSLSIPPGFYSFRVIVKLGEEISLGDKGLVEGADIPLIVAPGSDLYYFSYNALNGQIVALPVRSQIQISTSSGTFNFAPVEDDRFEVFYTAPAGEDTFQILVNGQPVFEETTNFELELRVRVVADADGNLDFYEEVKASSLTVTRFDPDGNIVPGSCFGLFNDEDALIAQRCDTEGSGVTTFAFPDSVDAGEYTLRETLTPEGFEPSSDQQLELNEGENTAETRP